jgi:predicted methyltransferase
MYHHIIEVDAFNTSLFASLKTGGRLAVIDFVAAKGSTLPAGVRANRGGHGVPPQVVIDEMIAAGFTHVRTIDAWPPGDEEPSYFLVLFRKR